MEDIWAYEGRGNLRVETLQSEELNALSSLPPIIRVVKSGRIRWSGYVARMREKRGAYGVFVGRPEGNRPLGTSVLK